MAVPAYLRQESKADFVTVATRLAAWTLKWCKDERLFTRRDLTNPILYAEREGYLRAALDHLTDMKVLLTIKYEMVLQGFNAAKNAAPQQQASKEAKNPDDEAAPPAKKKRGGRKVLTQDDIDRIFEIFFQMAIHEKGLIEGLMASDEKRRAAGQSPDSGPAKTPKGAGMAHK